MFSVIKIKRNKEGHPTQIITKGERYGFLIHTEFCGTERHSYRKSELQYHAADFSLRVDLLTPPTEYNKGIERFCREYNAYNSL